MEVNALIPLHFANPKTSIIGICLVKLVKQSIELGRSKPDVASGSVVAIKGKRLMIPVGCVVYGPNQFGETPSSVNTDVCFLHRICFCNSLITNKENAGSFASKWLAPTFSLSFAIS